MKATKEAPTKNLNKLIIPQGKSYTEGSDEEEATESKAEAKAEGDTDEETTKESETEGSAEETAEKLFNEATEAGTETCHALYKLLKDKYEGEKSKAVDEGEKAEYDMEGAE